jgi:hypothetical protein
MRCQCLPRTPMDCSGRSEGICITSAGWRCTCHGPSASAGRWIGNHLPRCFHSVS